MSMSVFHRYWVDEYGIMEREWNEHEYSNHNVTIPIQEKHWYNCCPVCRAYQGRALSKEDAKKNVHRCFSCINDKNKNKGYRIGYFSFRCMEDGVKFVPEFGVYVHYMEMKS